MAWSSGGDLTSLLQLDYEVVTINDTYELSSVECHKVQSEFIFILVHHSSLSKL